MCFSMQAEFVRVDLSKNGRSGLIALDDASVSLSGCTISGNRKHGLELQVLAHSVSRNKCARIAL